MSELNPRADRFQRYRRADASLPVRVSTIDSDFDPETGRPYFWMSETVCRDISRGGAFVTTQEPVRPGRRLLVELDLPDGQTVQAIGRVAWSRVRLANEGEDAHAGIGIEFLGGSADDLSTLERFVRRERARQQRPKSSIGAGPAARPGA